MHAYLNISTCKNEITMPALYIHIQSVHVQVDVVNKEFSGIPIISIEKIFCLILK